MIELNRYYTDRGIQKYNGFYLSEHTTDLLKEQEKRNQNYKAKNQLKGSEITAIINRAIQKNLQVAIQLNIRDSEGSMLPDVQGKILGGCDTEIQVDTATVPLFLIRNITFINDTDFSTK